MKKLGKSLTLIAMLAVMLLALTGCDSKKLVATKTTEQFGMKYEETIEVSFKGDEANEIVWTFDFEDESIAEAYANNFESEDGLKIERNGKKIIMTLDAKAFDELNNGNNSSNSRDEIRKALEDTGYTVK